jgi:hypothetical protein
MESNFVPGDQIQLSTNPLLIRRNDQFILVDTGMGKQIDGANGLLLHHLSRLGIEREQITSILLLFFFGQGLFYAELCPCQTCVELSIGLPFLAAWSIRMLR